MRKPAKILFWSLGVVVLLIVVAFAGLKLFLTKERILAWVLPPLEQRLHRRVSVQDAGVGWRGVYLKGVDVRAQGAEVPLVSAESLRVGWDLSSLLSRRLDIGEVRLVRPSIHVVRLPDGKLDIDDLTSPAPPPERPGSPTGGSAVAVTVGSLLVEKGQVSLEDRLQRPPRVYQLGDVDLRITDLSLERPLKYEISGRLPLAQAGRFSAQGTVNHDAKDATARIQIREFDLPSLNPVLEDPNKFASGVVKAELDADVSGGKRASLKGNVAISKLAFQTAAKGQPTEWAVAIDAKADLDGGAADIQRLDLDAAGQKLHAEGKITGLKARPRIDFRAESQEFSADAFGAVFPSGGEPESRVPEPRAGGPPGGPTHIPVDAYGEVRFGRLLAGGLALEDVTAQIALEKGQLRIEPAGARIYEGKLTLAARLELGNPGTPFSSTAQLSGAQVSPLLTALSPELKDVMTGILGANVEAQGVTPALEALQSKIRAEAKDGKIVNHPLVREFASLFKVKELETLNFYSLKLDLETAAGSGTLKSLILSGPDVQATAKGTIGLLDRALDLRLAVAVPRRIASKVIPGAQTLEAVTDEDGWTRLPLRLSGSLGAPSYGLDTEALTAEAGKVLGEKARKELEGRVLKNLPGGGARKEVEEGLKKLFGK